MQHRFLSARISRLWLFGGLIAAALFAYRIRNALLPVVQIAAGGAVLAFLLSPISDILERRLSPAPAALAALALAAAVLGGFLWLLLPMLTRQLYGAFEAMPQALQALRSLAERTAALLQAHGLSVPPPGQLDFARLGGRLVDLARGTIGAARSISSLLSRFSLMVVLCYFLLADRDRLLLRLELFIPLRMRHLAVEMASAVARELRQYLRAQGVIAVIVGLLASFGLMLVGVPSPLLLGITVGILNMIPYLGPVLGAIPALLLALGRGPLVVLWAGVALFAVQQLDGVVISPRIMGGLTGMSPAVVLLSIFFGASVAGIAGMLFALPVLLALRACLRVYAGRKLDTAALQGLDSIP